MPARKGNAARAKAQIEQFAQLLAQGKKHSECYAAIFPATKYPEKNVGRWLRMHPEAEARAKEILESRADKRNAVMTRAMDISGVNEAFVLQGLLENYERCMQHRPVYDRDGDMVYVETPSGEIAPAYAYDAKNALRALQMMGLKLGMFVMRHKHETNPFTNLPLPVMKALIEYLQGNEKVIEHDAASAPESVGGQSAGERAPGNLADAHATGELPAA